MNKNFSSITIIIDHCGVIRHFYICANRECEADHNDTAYSWYHAKKLGWHFTENEMYSENGDLVGVCPDCSKEHEWKEYRSRIMEMIN